MLKYILVVAAFLFSLNNATLFSVGSGHFSLNDIHELSIEDRLKFAEILDGSNTTLRLSACQYQAAYRLLEKEQNFIEAFKLLENARLHLTKQELKNSVLYAMILKALASTYFHFNDFNQSRNYYFMWYLHPLKYSGSIQGNLNDFGLTMQQLGRHELAVSIFLQALNVSIKSNDNVLTYVIYGNMGISLFALGHKEKAMQFFLWDYEGSIEHRNYTSAANVLVEYVKIEDGLSMQEKYRFLERAGKLYALSNDNPSWKLYYVQSNWFHDMADFKNAYDFLNTSILVRDDLLRKRDLSKIRAIGFEVFFDTRRMEFIEMNLKARYARVFYVFTATLLVLSLIYFVRKYIKDKRLIKRRLILSQYRAAIVKKELEDKKEQLDRLTRSLAQNNESLNHLEGLLRTYKDSGIASREKDTAIPEGLTKFSILTEEDWHEFKKLFSSVYPNFLANLALHYSDLTDAETRHACLLRLNKSSYEIATILAISKDSVRKSNHRLRQKMDFSEQAEMIEFLFSIPT